MTARQDLIRRTAKSLLEAHGIAVYGRVDIHCALMACGYDPGRVSDLAHSRLISDTQQAAFDIVRDNVTAKSPVV